MFTAGKSVLYLHDNWGENTLSDVMENLFEFSFPYGGNYWTADAALWNNVQEMQTSIFNGLGLESIDQILAHFQQNDYALDWSQCDDSGAGAGCQYSDAFGVGAAKLRSLITGLDQRKQVLFPNDGGYRFQKLLILLGDKYRHTVNFPMDKVATDDNEYFKSLFADYAVYNSRILDPVQPDMGNFSRSDFSHISPITKTVKLVTKQNFRSTGVYMLPGETMRVTRNDNAAVNTKVFINDLRSGSTHEFEQNGYVRPKFLQTPHFAITSQETLTLTSPYGGPVYIDFDTNEQNVSFTFENIGEHPYWTSPADNARFGEQLDAGEYDWAELVTSGFEVHSTLEKMRESIADPIWGSAEALAEGTKQYIGDFPYVLAGFKGPGVDVIDEIHDFATEKGLTINVIDQVQHMNADQATCGYGCSGNPYDAYWAFSPIGHGDIHELGHNLEKSRFMFEGFELHAITNPYSYYTKSKYNEITGGDTDCQNLPFRTLFEKIQASTHEANATQYLKDNLWSSSNWSHQVLVTIQAMMQTQAMGKLDNGWHLLARLHILERQITWAKADWENRKASLGFTNYSLSEFNAIRNNDWLVISFSFAAGLDFRDYLTMMGMEYSQKAADQVASFGYEMVPQRFFLSTPNGYCKSDDIYGAYLNKDTLPIDGNVSGWVADSEYTTP